ncbi:MAG: hypothetical protein GEU76_03845 [Alphaproteobacteria bacterium]|nr:hypothetical protein [Alphaproteobacteria bacterium]
MKRAAMNRLKGHPDKGLFCHYDRWLEDRTPYRARRVLRCRARTIEGLWLKANVGWYMLAGDESCDGRDLSTLGPVNVLGAVMGDVGRLAAASLSSVPYSHNRLP